MANPKLTPFSSDYFDQFEKAMAHCTRAVILATDKINSAIMSSTNQTKAQWIQANQSMVQSSTSAAAAIQASVNTTAGQTQKAINVNQALGFSHSVLMQQAAKASASVVGSNTRTASSYQLLRQAAKAARQQMVTDADITKNALASIVTQLTHTDKLYQTFQTRHTSATHTSQGLKTPVMHVATALFAQMTHQEKLLTTAAEKSREVVKNMGGSFDHPLNKHFGTMDILANQVTPKANLNSLGVQVGEKVAGAGLSEMATVLGKIGPMIVDLAPALAELSGGAALIIAIVKAMLDLNEVQTKWAHQTGGDLEVAKAFTFRISNLSLATHKSTEELYEMAETFEDVGVKMVDGGDKADAYLKIASKWSRVLGVNNEMMAQSIMYNEQVGGTTEDLNKTYDDLAKSAYKLGLTQKDYNTALSEGLELWKDYGTVSGATQKEMSDDVQNATAVFKAFNLDQSKIKSALQAENDPKKQLIAMSYEFNHGGKAAGDTRNFDKWSEDMRANAGDREMAHIRTALQMAKDTPNLEWGKDKNKVSDAQRYGRKLQLGLLEGHVGSNEAFSSINQFYEWQKKNKGKSEEDYITETWGKQGNKSADKDAGSGSAREMTENLSAGSTMQQISLAIAQTVNNIAFTITEIAKFMSFGRIGGEAPKKSLVGPPMDLGFAGNMMGLGGGLNLGNSLASGAVSMIGEDNIKSAQKGFSDWATTPDYSFDKSVGDMWNSATSPKNLKGANDWLSGNTPIQQSRMKEAGITGLPSMSLGGTGMTQEQAQVQLAKDVHLIAGIIGDGWKFLTDAWKMLEKANPLGMFNKKDGGSAPGKGGSSPGFGIPSGSPVNQGLSDAIGSALDPKDSKLFSASGLPNKGGKFNKKDKAAYIMDFYIKNGYSKEQAAGIVGNFISESGLNSAILGDHGTSGGIGQWHNERFQALQAFAGKRHKPWQDLNTQLDFSAQEIKARGEDKHIKSMISSGQVASYFLQHDERAKDHISGGVTDRARIGNASLAMEYYTSRVDKLVALQTETNEHLSVLKKQGHEAKTDRKQAVATMKVAAHISNPGADAYNKATLSNLH